MQNDLKDLRALSSLEYFLSMDRVEGGVYLKKSARPLSAFSLGAYCLGFEKDEGGGT